MWGRIPLCYISSPKRKTSLIDALLDILTYTFCKLLGKKPFKDKLQPSSSLAGATSSKTQTTSKKAKLDKASRKRRHVSSSSDYSEDESGSYDTSDEEDAASEAKDKMSKPKSKSTTIKRLLQAASEPGSSNKLSVSVQTEGRSYTLHIAKILSDKNALAWVSMFFT